jgi:ATP-binding cassette subfamily B protein
VLAAVPLLADQWARKIVNSAHMGTAEEFRLQRHLFELGTEPGPGKEIRVADVATELVRRQKTAWDDAMMGRFRAMVRAAGWKCAGWTVFALGFTVTLALVVSQAAGGGASPGDLVLVVTLAVTLLQAVQNGISQATGTLNAGRHIGPYLWLQEYATRQKARYVAAARPPNRLRTGISIKDLRYTYPGGARPAVDGVSVDIPAGSVVAVVGEHGCGKTTLVKLISKFYRPDSGVIQVDGHDLSDFAGSEWLAGSSAAYQDFGRYPHISFAEAIGIGDLAARSDEGRIRYAMRFAGADDVCHGLPDGAGTILSRTFGGVDLSEGQWQKVALARASMRVEPILFILDEPTASLDAPSEKAVFDSYMSRSRALAARNGTITIVVSHRFSTVRGADLILVMDNGRLVEHGSHDQLIGSGGRYSELYAIQERAYRLPV